MPKPVNLFSELTKGNFFNQELTSSPLSDSEINPFDKKKEKRHSNSPLFINSPNLEEEIRIENALADLVLDLENEVSHQAEDTQEILEANEKLKNKLSQSETAYQILVEEQAKLKKEVQITLKANEELINKLNQEKLDRETHQGYLQEEANELKYQLSEANSKARSNKEWGQKVYQKEQRAHTKTKKEIKEWQNISAELADELEQKEISQGSLNQLEEAVNQSENKVQKAQQIFSELKAQILDINNKIIKK